MSKGRKDDRRFMTFEQRARDDARYRGVSGSGRKGIETCYCGKTVVAVNGRPTGATCPRHCEDERDA